MKTKTSVAIEADKIRANLKASGITSRQVSVKSENYSMGSSIRVVIRDLSIAYGFVESIAKGSEKIDRDDSGEILSGGNRYVSVDIDRDAVNAVVDALVVDEAAGLPLSYKGVVIERLANPIRKSPTPTRVRASAAGTRCTASSGRSAASLRSRIGSATRPDRILARTLLKKDV